MESFNIIKIKGNIREAVEDIVASEVPFTINVRGKELVTLLCTPEDLEDLVMGFFFTSGLIREKRDIKDIVIDRVKWTAHVDLAVDINTEELIFKRLYTSGCGRGTLFYNVFDIANRTKIDSEFTLKNTQIKLLLEDFQKKSRIFLKTGGVHSAAISDKNSIIVFREDIGRHNALDKVIGSMLAEGADMSNKAMITSGRISSEVLFKAHKCRIPILISRSAPTNQAVRLAREMGITVIGFARGSRMNVYSSEQRVIV